MQMRENILGVNVSAINMPMALSAIDAWIAIAAKEYICLTDVNGIMASHRDSSVRDSYNKAGLATPDGMPLVWLLRHAGHRRVDRVYGPDLMLAVFDHGQQHGYKHFLYGATPETLKQLQHNLLVRYPAAQIVGSYAPPFRPLDADERAQVIEDINVSEADMVWVCLGAPKQELWMAANREALNAPVLLGVGAAFDIHAGNVRQSPRFIQRSGFEWLFRLACEPRRLYKRYLTNNPAFVFLIMRQKIKEMVCRRM